MKELPDKYFIRTTVENHNILYSWLKQAMNTEDLDTSIGNYYCFNGDRIRGWMYHAKGYDRDYTEISFSDFQRLVLKKQIEYEIY